MADVHDGRWQLFDYDAATGRSVWVTEGDIPGQMIFRIDTPVDEILEANVEAEKATHGQRFGDWNRAASIPLQLYHSAGLAEAAREGDDAYLRRFLNDGDNAKFRTSRGRL